MKNSHPSITSTRHRLKLTQAEFAKRVGYSKSAIEKHERAERRGVKINPRILNLLTK